MILIGNIFCYRSVVLFIHDDQLYENIFLWYHEDFQNVFFLLQIFIRIKYSQVPL